MKCLGCQKKVGVDLGLAPYFTDDKTYCARCSGQGAAKCRRCEVEFVDIGTSSCPFCGYPSCKPL